MVQHWPFVWEWLTTVDQECDKALENASLTKPDGTAVQVSKCPEGHGKIKSPLCCGEDMSCSV